MRKIKIINLLIFNSFFLSILSSGQYSLESNFSQIKYNQDDPQPTSAKYKIVSEVDPSISKAYAVSGRNYSITPVQSNSTVIKLANLDLDSAHVYPNPCKVYEGYNFITFTDLTKEANIKIYTISGNLVKEINKTDITNNIKWDLTNNYGESISSGVYIYIIKVGSMSKRGKIVVIK